MLSRLAWISCAAGEATGLSAVQMTPLASPPRLPLPFRPTPSPETKQTNSNKLQLPSRATPRCCRTHTPLTCSTCTVICSSVIRSWKRSLKACTDSRPLTKHGRHESARSTAVSCISRGHIAHVKGQASTPAPSHKRGRRCLSVQRGDKPAKIMVGDAGGKPGLGGRPVSEQAGR